MIDSDHVKRILSYTIVFNQLQYNYNEEVNSLNKPLMYKVAVVLVLVMEEPPIT